MQPKSLFIGLRRSVFRAVFPHENSLDHAMRSAKEVGLPYNYMGGWDVLYVIIEKIGVFPDGKVLTCKPIAGSPENWSVIHIWVPNVGSCGILN